MSGEEWVTGGLGVQPVDDQPDVAPCGVGETIVDRRGEPVDDRTEVWRIR